MAAPSGISAQLALLVESVYGTAVTVSRFYEVRLFNVKYHKARIVSDAIRAGSSVERSDDWMAGAETVSGTVELDLTTKNIAYLLQFLGFTVATAGAGPYTHSGTPVAGNLTGKSFTLQGGFPDTSGTVQPFTWSGCKVTKWGLSWTANESEPIKLSLDIVGQTQTTATGLAAASYTASNAIFSWVHAATTFAGSAVKVKKFELSGDLGLDVERFHGGSALMSEPLEAAKRAYTGAALLDFTGLTDINRYWNGTETALVQTITRSTDVVTITANARFDGDPPEVSGRGLLEVNMPFTCVATGADSTALTVVVTSGEATP